MGRFSDRVFQSGIVAVPAAGAWPDAENGDADDNLGTCSRLGNGDQFDSDVPLLTIKLDRLRPFKGGL
jgi:hypothetical protein